MPMHDWTRIDPNDYHHFHGRWIFAITDALNAGRLPAGFFAMAEHQTPPIIPDVLTLTLPPRGERKTGEPGSAGTLTVPQTHFTATARRRRRTRPAQRRIIIQHAQNRQIVAVIEIVSPSNKAKRVDFTAFINKAVVLLQQGIHLIVVDPFPPTPRDPQGIHAAIWRALTREKFTLPADKPLTLVAYAAGPDDYQTYVEPVAVGDQLPDMPLFITPDWHIPVPLEATYQTAWQSFPSDLHPLLETPADA